MQHTEVRHAERRLSMLTDALIYSTQASRSLSANVRRRMRGAVAVGLGFEEKEDDLHWLRQAAPPAGLPDIEPLASNGSEHPLSL